jgi:peptidyl-prolyl cis-trans isomerase SurA
MSAQTIQLGQMTKPCGASWRRAGAVLMLVLAATAAHAQSGSPVSNTTAAPPLPTPPASSTSAATSDAPPTQIVQPDLPGMPHVQGAEIDRLMAIVNGDLILDSDVNQEQRFTRLLPYSVGGAVESRSSAVERLINRDLILQQVQLQPGSDVSLDAAQKDLNKLRSTVPQCKQYHCETTAGWDKFLATEGFTPESLTRLWRLRMEVLAFIEQRFRMGITISPQEIQTYYEKTMLPEYAAMHATPPPVSVISRRISEVLLQQQVSKLLDDWLQSLRAQGSVVVLHPTREAP